MIRRTGIALTVVGGMTAVLGLFWWDSNAAAGKQQVRSAQAGALFETAAPTSAPSLTTSPPAAVAEQSPEPAAGATSETAANGPAANIGVATLNAKDLPKMGKAVVDAEGWVLYRFDKDTPKPPKSNCEGDCAVKWPPVLTNGTPNLQGVDPALVGTVKRADGSDQVTLAGWALYRFAGDKKPGQWKGQGVGGTWFVVQPDGKKNLSCLPTTAQQPPANSGGGTGY